MGLNCQIIKERKSIENKNIVKTIQIIDMQDLTNSENCVTMMEHLWITLSHIFHLILYKL